MVQIRSTDPVTIYEVIDDGGHTLGRVVEPAGAPRVGRGEETVLLQRGSSRIV